MTPPSFPCVALVPSGAVLDPAFEDALQVLNNRGFLIHRARLPEPPAAFRDRMAAKAMADGFTELLWLHPAVSFDPADVDRLRALSVPIASGVYPWPGRRGLACAFQPGTAVVRFGRGGGPLPVVSCGLGFALIRRGVFEAIAAASPAGTPAVYFGTGDPTTGPAAEDAAFCSRARACGFEIVADTSVRLWVIGPARLGWEDAGGDRDRHPDFTLRIAGATPPAAAPAPGDPHPQPVRSPLRPPAAPLPATFPRLGLYIVTYPANAASLRATVESVRASDWGAEPEVVSQPDDWPLGRDSGSATYLRALEAAWADGCDFAVILEDDVRVSRHLRHNLLTNPMVVREQCDYLGLFLPDTIADPWERVEPHLGYRLARPRYAGPNQLWTRTRVWGSQALVLSRRLVRAAIDVWDRMAEGQDSRMMGVCAEFRVPLWYSLPCLADHAPVVSAFNTPDAFAPDFDPDFRLILGGGHQPPDGVPGWLTLPEAELLWRTAAGLDVLELGTACGRSTVCLAQSARRVVSVDVADQAEAAEWVRRFGAETRVELVRGDAATVCRGLSGPFGLAFIDTGHDEASVIRDIDAALHVLMPAGLLAFHDYPDPGYPDVRRVVDEYARRLGWKRIAQADFLAVFRT